MNHFLCNTTETYTALEVNKSEGFVWEATFNHFLLQSNILWKHMYFFRRNNVGGPTLVSLAVVDS